jgi:hypothetical protein
MCLIDEIKKHILNIKQHWPIIVQIFCKFTTHKRCRLILSHIIFYLKFFLEIILIETELTSVSLACRPRDRSFRTRHDWQHFYSHSHTSILKTSFNFMFQHFISNWIPSSVYKLGMRVFNAKKYLIPLISKATDTLYFSPLCTPFQVSIYKISVYVLEWFSQPYSKLRH